MLLVSFTIVLLLNLWYRFTLEHYVPPPNFCLFAQTCNHTWVPLCGIEINLKHNRMFLDKCDMFEYNCDYQKEYFSTESDKCFEETLPTSMQTAPMEHTTMNTTSPSKSTSTTTKMTTTKPAPTTTETTTYVTTEGITNLTDSTTQMEITSESTISETTQAITTTLTTTTELTKLPTTESEDVSNVTTSILTSCTARSTTVPHDHLDTNFSSSTHTTEQITLTITSTPSTSSQKDIPSSTTFITTIDEQNSSSPVTCDIYPEHCDRPRTWETTVKGETRDFFQILKARFGDRFRILRDTTHWPRRVAPHMNDIDDGFEFGRHDERKLFD